MTDLQKFTTTLDEIGITYVIREEEGYTYICFDYDFFFEFDPNGSLTSYPCIPYRQVQHDIG